VKPFILALACCTLVACSEQLPVSQSDKELFIRPADFAGFNIRFENAEALEKFTSARLADGSRELTHTFTAAQGSSHSLYLYSSITVTRRESDAALTSGAEKVGLLVAFKKEGVVEREVPGVKTGKLTLLVKDGRPIGNVFTVRDGAKSYLLVMSGVFFQHADPWNKLIGPKLQRLQVYVPELKS
jgi:hypothetical protein